MKIVLFLALLPMAIFAPQPTMAGQSYLQEAVSLIDNGGFITTRHEHILAQLKPDTAFIPASTWKIATAALALRVLGVDYHFKTFFYQDDQGRLFIRGLGDPFLTSEEISRLRPNLDQALTIPISAIVIDDHNFQLDAPTAGSSATLNPYDAVPGALAVNFNTINLRINNTTGPVVITSAEQQTPYLPIMAALGENLRPGKHRISLHEKKNTALYAGQLFTAIGNLPTARPQAPAPMSFPPITIGKTPADLTPIYINNNDKDLQEIIKALLLYSNNFIANQLFLTCGARRFGWPATWEKGRRAMREFLTKIVKLPANSYNVVEGSGLSRRNRITPAAMLKLLRYFRPHAALLPTHHGQKMKSGTLTGVYTYVGYLGGSGNDAPFVLLLNQPVNNRDKVVELLLADYKSQIN